MWGRAKQVMEEWKGQLRSLWLSHMLPFLAVDAIKSKLKMGLNLGRLTSCHFSGIRTINYGVQQLFCFNCDNLITAESVVQLWSQ